MAKESVDYNKLKAQVDMEACFTALDLQGHFTAQGQNYRGGCLVHDGRAKGTAFSIRIDTGAYKCWCTACDGKTTGKGVIDLTALVLGLDTTAAGVELAKRTNNHDLIKNYKPKEIDQNVIDLDSLVIPHFDDDYSPELQPALGFELDKLDPQHQEVTKLGLGERLLSSLGMGYCTSSNKWLSNKVAFPFVGKKNEILAYVGISRQGESFLYSFPPNDKFNPELDIYNFYDAAQWLKRSSCTNPLIVCEDYMDCFWLFNSGYDCTVVLPTKDLSQEQLYYFVQLYKWVQKGKIIYLSRGDTTSSLRNTFLLSRIFPVSYRNIGGGLHRQPYTALLNLLGSPPAQ